MRDVYCINLPLIHFILSNVVIATSKADCVIELNTNKESNEVINEKVVAGKTVASSDKQAGMMCECIVAINRYCGLLE